MVQYLLCKKAFLTFCKTAWLHLSVGIGTKAAQFLFWEYINWSFGTVWCMALPAPICRLPIPALS